MEHSLITTDIAIKIIDSRRPRGLFWAKELNGRYVAIDNIAGEAQTRGFKNLKDCLGWLKMRGEIKYEQCCTDREID